MEQDATLSSRLDVWLASPRLPVNYRLGTIEAEPIPSGGYRHRIEVIR